RAGGGATSAGGGGGTGAGPGTGAWAAADGVGAAAALSPPPAQDTKPTTSAIAAIPSSAYPPIVSGDMPRDGSGWVTSMSPRPPVGPGCRRARSARVHPEAARRPSVLAAGAQPPQPLDQHRVGGHRGRLVDQGVEHLVVPGIGHVEQLADRLFLGARVLPPLALERENLALPQLQLATECPEPRHHLDRVHSRTSNDRIDV